LTSRFGAQAILFEVQRTVRQWPTDYPRAPCSSRVVQFLRVCAWIFRGAKVLWQKVWQTVRLNVADSPRSTSCSRTVRGQGADRPFFEVRFWRFCCVFWTVRSRVADRPPSARGPSAPASRTVRLGFRRVAKSFASLVSLSLWDCLGLYLVLVGPL
jgi:hypothetical protein